MRYLLTTPLLLLLFITTAQAQIHSEDYDWSETMSYQAIPKEFKDEKAVIVKDFCNIWYEFGYNNMFCSKLVHKVIKINKADAIDQYNKVFIPTLDEANVSIKARTKSPSGKVTTLNEKNIKKITNEEEYGNFTVFAIDGVEEGSILEYFYTLEQEPRTAGIQIFQEEVPILHAEFSITTPKKIVFEGKAYNGLQNPAYYTKGNKNILISKSINVKPLIKEDFSAYESNRAYIAYKLGGKDGFTWNSVANNIRESTMEVKVKHLDQVMTQNELIKSSTEETIQAIETWVKENINYQDDYTDQLSDVNKILIRKTGNDAALSGLYYHMLKHAGIKSYLGVSVNRFDFRFDKDFAIPNVLRDFIVYIPKTKKYIVPNRIDLRYGEPPFYLAENNALFISENSSKVFRISMPDQHFTYSGVTVDAKISNDFSELVYDKTWTWKGYYAAMNRGLFNLAPQAIKDDFINNYFISDLGSANKTEAIIQGESFDHNYGNKALTVQSTVTSPSLIQNAGNFYILNLGLVIGRQAELFQEHERTNPVELQFPHLIEHNITFTIPEGYTVEGAEDFEIHKICSDEDNTLAAFDSEVEVSDNQIKIKVIETYNQTKMNIDDYEAFRSVINAAAEFSNASIILQKKN